MVNSYQSNALRKHPGVKDILCGCMLRLVAPSDLRLRALCAFSVLIPCTIQTKAMVMMVMCA